MYGSAEAPLLQSRKFLKEEGEERLGKRNSNVAALTGAFLVPVFLFISVFAVRSFKIRYDDPSIAWILSLLVLLVVFGIGGMAAGAMNNPASGDFRIMVFMFLCSFLAWLIAYVAGDFNYMYNMKPYYDISNLNVYPSVNPSVFMGSQLMDAGVVTFTQGTKLDLTKSAGFKNKDTYCVAPIVGGNETAGANKTQTYFDFWAIGLNCCGGHISDFHCGEYNNPKAHSGLRLLRDDQRQYFRLAVEMAESSFNIKAGHPIFMYYLSDPAIEVASYQDQGYKQFMFAFTGFLAGQLILTVLAGIALAKL